MKSALAFAVVMSIVVASPGQEFKQQSNKVTVDFTVPPPVEQRPVVIWLAPDQQSSSITVRKMVVKIGVNSVLKLKNVKLLVNDIAPSDDRGVGAPSTEAAKFASYIEREIDLAEGPNQVKIIAENEAGQITTEFRSVNVTLSLVSTLAARTDYALLFATNNYDDWSGLTNPISDAEAIKKDLEELYGYKVELVKNPTKSEFLSKLREYGLKNYLPDDQLFVFIAGHGKFDEVIKDGYIVAKDSKRSDENSESYISFSDLRTRLDNNPCRHVFLTMDACFGGTFDQAVAKRGSDDDDDELAFNTAVQADMIKRKLQYKSRIFLTSGGKQYVSDGRAGRHSPFASLFLEAMRSGGGRMRVLTTSMIFSYVEPAKQVPHYGVFGDNEPGSEFVFVRK